MCFSKCVIEGNCKKIVRGRLSKDGKILRTYTSDYRHSTTFYSGDSEWRIEQEAVHAELEWRKHIFSTCEKGDEYYSFWKAHVEKLEQAVNKLCPKDFDIIGAFTFFTGEVGIIPFEVTEYHSIENILLKTLSEGKHYTPQLTHIVQQKLDNPHIYRQLVHKRLLSMERNGLVKWERDREIWGITKAGLIVFKMKQFQTTRMAA